MLLRLLAVLAIVAIEELSEDIISKIKAWLDTKGQNEKK